MKADTMLDLIAAAAELCRRQAARAAESDQPAVAAPWVRYGAVLRKAHAAMLAIADRYP